MARIPEPLERLTIATRATPSPPWWRCSRSLTGLSHEHPQVAFVDGTTGRVVEIRAGGLRPAAKTFTTMVGLHERISPGRSCGCCSPCAADGTAMVGTGHVLWTVARLPKGGALPGFGWRLVQGLNIGADAGLPAAVAAYLLANRLLPSACPGGRRRRCWAFFATIPALWGAGTVAAFRAPLRPRRTWSAAMALAAMLYLAAAPADVLTTRAVWDDPVWFLGFDAVLVALAAALGLIAHKAARYAAPAGRARRTAPVPVAVDTGTRLAAHESGRRRAGSRPRPGRFRRPAPRPSRHHEAAFAAPPSRRRVVAHGPEAGARSALSLAAAIRSEAARFGPVLWCGALTRRRRSPSRSWPPTAASRLVGDPHASPRRCRGAHEPGRRRRVTCAGLQSRREFLSKNS